MALAGTAGGVSAPSREELRGAYGRVIPDLVGPDLRVLLVGINPSLWSGWSGQHFGRPSNRLWPTLHEAGFTARRLRPEETGELLAAGIGITNLVNRATAAQFGIEAVGELDELLPRCDFLTVHTTLSDQTRGLIDARRLALLPKGARVGGPLDRDQWTTILQVVSAVTAYRWIYPEGLKPWLIADLLIWRREMPRSLAACVSEVVEMLTEIGGVTGRQGEADRQARIRQAELLRVSGQELFQAGLHEFLAAFITENATMDQAIATQFRFG